VRRQGYVQRGGPGAAGATPNRGLEQTLQIFRAATTFFARERPATPLVCGFIDEHNERFGVVPICRALAIQGCGDCPAHLPGAPLVGAVEAEPVAKYTARRNPSEAIVASGSRRVRSTVRLRPNNAGRQIRDNRSPDLPRE